jgi:amino acid transporter
VAYEGFELIPNAVNEMENPYRDLGRGILISILVTTTIYIVVSLVAVGNLLPEEISRYKEYALAVAARPFLGKAGFMLVGLGALLSTASAINATLFGTARLGMVMAQESEFPQVFSHKERTKDIPYVSLVFISAVALLFVNITNLTIISSFASSTFLLVFAAINLSAIRLRKRTGINMIVPLSGVLLSLASWAILCVYLYRTDWRGLAWTGAIYLCVIVAELFFSKRKLFFKLGVDK